MMDFEGYRKEYFSTWQRRIERFCWVLFFIIGIAKIGSFAVHAYFKTLDDAEMRYFITFRFIAPTIIQLAFLFTAHVFLKKPSLSIHAKNNIVVIMFLGNMAAISIFNCTFTGSMIAPSLAMIFSAIVMQPRLLRGVFISCLGILAVSALVLITTTPITSIYNTVVSIFILFMINIGNFVLSTEIYKGSISQIEYIRSGYEKQCALAEELQREPLTNLYNRRSLAGAIERLMHLSNENGDNAILVFLDLDNFKQINDSYGHSAGDAVLITLAEVIISNLETNRSAFRYGGDEFVILMHNKNLAEAISIVEKIRREFFDTEFDFMQEQSHCSLSIGIALYQKGWSSADWVKAADSAVYKAKQNGKNRYEITD